jgi:hypothetical protein
MIEVIDTPEASHDVKYSLTVLKRTLAAAIILFTASAPAATISTLAPSPTPPTNAYWQIIDEGGDGVLACVLEGQTTYGNGDDCRIRNADPLDFTGATELTIDFDVKLLNYSSNDYCLFQMRDMDDASWTTIDWFYLYTSGYEHRSYDLIGGEWGDWSTEDEVYVRFRWVSNASGTDEGVRINDFLLEGSTYANANVLTWTSDHDAYGPGEEVNIDCSSYLDVDDTFYFEFNYDDAGAWAWWIYVDDVRVYDSGGDLLPTETFDDWMPDGWWQDQHGEPGQWEQRYEGYVPDPPCAGCRDGGPYDASLFCPEMLCDDTDVWLHFIGCYNNIGPDEFKIDIWVAPPGFTDFYDDFEGDLSLWAVVDSGSDNVNIESRSLGIIKGMYR